MIKRFKNFLNEYYDSPEVPKVFSEEELRKAAFADDPYSKTAEFRPFQYGLHYGKVSGELNDLINRTRFSTDSMFGVSDYLYSELIKAVPDFKTFKFNEDEDIWGNLKDGKIGMHLQKLIKLPGTRFSAESELWLYYHIKSDKILDYEKGKIYMLFVSGLRPTKKVFSPMGGLGEPDEEEQEAKNAFGKLVQDSSKGKEMDGKKFDNFLAKLDEILAGHPDKEDKALFNRLYITRKNLSLPTFFKTLPKVKSNLDYFKRYLKNKYELQF